MVHGMEGMKEESFPIFRIGKMLGLQAANCKHKD